MTPRVGTTASTGRESCHARKCQLWLPGAQSSKDTTVIFPPQHSAGLIQLGQMEGCCCWGGDTGGQGESQN